MTERRSDLDALRSFAMALGIVVHATLSFYQAPWPVHDTRPSGLLSLAFLAIHARLSPSKDMPTARAVGLATCPPGSTVGFRPIGRFAYGLPDGCIR